MCDPPGAYFYGEYKYFFKKDNAGASFLRILHLAIPFFYRLRIKPCIGKQWHGFAFQYCETLSHYMWTWRSHSFCTCPFRIWLSAVTEQNHTVQGTPSTGITKESSYSYISSSNIRWMTQCTVLKGKTMSGRMYWGPCWEQSCGDAWRIRYTVQTELNTVLPALSILRAALMI